VLWLALLVAQGAAQPDSAALGAKVFAKSCAVGYCHGSGGAAGRAPRIQGRSFTAEYLLKVTREGIPGTAMPAWQGRLTEAEIRGVVAYMLSISASPGAAPAAPAPAGEAPVAMPARARAGKDRFFDAVRGVRCGTCHAAENWGVPVGPNLAATPPESVAAVRGVRAKHVRLARLAGGEEFPALEVEAKGGWVKLYDLTVPPPVLRTVPAGEVKFSEASAWDHAAAIASYTDDELEAILDYLRWLASR
jgi:mono/diheme cytochrome c family protein